MIEQPIEVSDKDLIELRREAIGRVLDDHANEIISAYQQQNDGIVKWDKGRYVLAVDRILKRNIKEELIVQFKHKQAAYRERDALVCLLSKIFPAHMVLDEKTEPEWANVVCIHTPVGQAAWHIHQREKPMFRHLQVRPDDWDGHTTEEKYKRLSRFKMRRFYGKTQRSNNGTRQSSPRPNGRPEHGQQAAG